MEGELMSRQYRAMVYFVVATLYMYRDDLQPIGSGELLGDFAEKNRAVLAQVGREALEYFDYELSHEQIGIGIRAFLSPSAKLEAIGVQPTPA